MDKLKKAIEVLKNGGIVIFPTDTAIGIGCRIDNKDSVRRLFEIRKRPENKPMLALVDSVEMAQNYLLPIPQGVKKLLIEKYWPGELTIILKCDMNKVPAIVRSGRKTLGVRFPDNSKLIEMLNRVGVPIVAPSANFEGEKTPFRLKDLNPELAKQADFILNEKINGQKVSTVIDCSVSPWKIIRQGATKVKSHPFGRLRSKVKNAILLLDTADNKKITVGLKINKKMFVQSKKIDSNKSQIILPMIDEILKEHALKLEDISEIKINTGPGSFTGLRVGLAIANALSFVLKIPVNGNKIGEIIQPVYK